MKWLPLIYIIGFTQLLSAQSVTNGDFTSGSSGWGCNPEMNAESVYGGVSTTNMTAEIDEAANLCQVISGFIIGSVYRFSIDYSRRTGGCPGPNPAGATITLSNSALTASISSSVSNFSFQTAIFTFTATQTSLTLNITPNFSGTTCGLIIDNVDITLFSGLPIKLLYFKAMANGAKDDLEWETATELNNDFFTIEHSQDAIQWEEKERVRGAGNSIERKKYTASVLDIMDGVSYYRLKQTDYNKTVAYSSIVAVERRGDESITVFPLPANDELMIRSKHDKNLLGLSLITASGQELQVDYTKEDSTIRMNLQSLDAGVYTTKLIYGKNIVYKRIVIVKQ